MFLVEELLVSVEALVLLRLEVLSVFCEALVLERDVELPVTFCLVEEPRSFLLRYVVVLVEAFADSAALLSSSDLCLRVIFPELILR